MRIHHRTGRSAFRHLSHGLATSPAVGELVAGQVGYEGRGAVPRGATSPFPAHSAPNATDFGRHIGQAPLDLSGEIVVRGRQQEPDVESTLRSTGKQLQQDEIGLIDNGEILPCRRAQEEGSMKRATAWDHKAENGPLDRGRTIRSG